MRKGILILKGRCCSFAGKTIRNKAFEMQVVLIFFFSSAKKPE